MLAVPAHASAHRISAVGHAHIDSAWLWPLRETVRKVARTVANVIALMDDDPDVPSSRCRRRSSSPGSRSTSPRCSRRVKAHVADGQFVPVGGMWVESDTNMPGGEALARQFVHGKRFFLDEFGIETEEVWLPDSFGYSAALPQLIRRSGSRWFLTQKISWNQTNTFPHHTFLLGGHRRHAHLHATSRRWTRTTRSCPAPSSRTRRATSREKGRATRSLVPFGWGDGGGGPTREMLARAHRTARPRGFAPRGARVAGPVLRARPRPSTRTPPVWSGELYLELHRGTYTSQARTK